MTEYLGYSEGAAQRRIQAMRLIKHLPEVEKKIETGEISLTVASQVQGFFQREDKKRISDKTNKLTRGEKLKLVQKLEGTSSRTCERKLAEISPETGIPKEKTKILTSDKILIQFVATHDLLNKIQRLKDLTSHTNPEGSYEKLITKLVELGLDKLDPARREQRRQTRTTQRSKNKKNPEHLKTAKKHPPTTKSPWVGPVWSPNPGGEPKRMPFDLGSTKVPPPAPAVESRHIPNQLKDKIWVRDHGRCQFINRKTGRKCWSTHGLQVDHRFPFALGGEHSEKNLRLLCHQHNQYGAAGVFGNGHREIRKITRGAGVES